MSMLLDVCMGTAHHQTPGHSQVHDPLRAGIASRNLVSSCPAACSEARPSRGVAGIPFQVNDDMFSDAPDSKYAGMVKSCGDLRCRGFERLGLAAQPDRLNHVSSHPLG